eukprot:CAMPEP_0182865674 /NCGR_PEP_ID=MMETSP0034_2-20130328/7815_1 /TAXON_ID=156128 /ORGANISM="Nephroselmis pyriformis, Strain CCMP717" /LENGTH=436 /DNA_ID=CAMNT_0024997985 /DNA_START=152 /DNA_END=1462 /DNA_ORIENTATION=+
MRQNKATLKVAVVVTVVIGLVLFLSQFGKKDFGVMGSPSGSQKNLPAFELRHQGEKIASEMRLAPKHDPLDFNEDLALRSCKGRGRKDGKEKITVLITGTGGFVGFHTAKALRRRGDGVLGLDNFNDYYPVSLKRARAADLAVAGVYTVEADLNDAGVLERIFNLCEFTHVLHLAAQAGVRYAAKNPGAYVHSNVAGQITLFEAIKTHAPTAAVVYASSSSVYGLNTKQPFSEADRVDQPASLYAATKKADEMFAHTYNHIHGMAVTGLRFFTVYGPWGRPDMAYFSFAKNIMNGEPIKIFQGPGGTELARDFTYIDDIVQGCIASLDTSEPSGKGPNGEKPPYRIYNLGNTHPVEVSDFVGVIEKHLGKKAIRQYIPMPKTGDVPFTHADVSKAREELGYNPTTSLSVGIGRFVKWYKEYYSGGVSAEEAEYKPY